MSLSKSPQTEQEKLKDMRIVLVGKTGVGKSAAGNTILGTEAFISDLTSSSVTSECEKQRGKVDGTTVAVIDTPGLFDTELGNDDIIKEVVKCISFSSPGPHVFLVILQLGRFTQEEKDTVKIIQTTFPESAKYTMVLFTHGDRLKRKTIEEFLSGSKSLSAFCHQCRGGYHVFNNEDMQNRSQVTKLLQKISEMVKENGGGCYTNQMLIEAEEAIEKQKRKILKGKEEMICREEKALKEKYEGENLEKAKEKLRVKYEKEARENAEKTNSFLNKLTKLFLSVLGKIGEAAADDFVVSISEQCTIQ